MSLDADALNDNKSEDQPHTQVNKCLNEKRRREQENIYIEELAELIAASTSDMSSLPSMKPDKCAILQETVNQIRRIGEQDSHQCNDLQQSVVSSSKPSIICNDLLGPLLLEALDGFLFVINSDGKIEFVSENIVHFLNYNQDDLQEKSIFDIVHVNDRPHFSSNLLPLCLNSPTAPRNRTFNCRLLIKNDENANDDKPIQYENMQLALVLLFSGETSSGADNQNRVVCVARRIAANERGAVSVEQFTTRLDLHGRILAVDTTGLPANLACVLKEEISGRLLQELCAPQDLSKLTQHLKETLQTGSNTSGIYKLRLVKDKFVHVQTKSRRFTRTSSQPAGVSQEFIMATHSIIRSGLPHRSEQDLMFMCRRDSDSLDGLGGGSRSNPSPATGEPPTLSFGSALSPPTVDFATAGFGDLSLELFPNANWDLEPGPSRPRNRSPPVAETSSLFASASTGGPDLNLHHHQRLRNLLTADRPATVASNENIILRELLNQEDEDMAAAAADLNAKRFDTKASLPAPMEASCKTEMMNDPNSRRKALNNNNMLRKLLNNDDDNERYSKKDQELLIQQLLKPESPEKRGDSLDAEQSKSAELLLKQLGLDYGGASTSEVVVHQTPPQLAPVSVAGGVKRKSPAALEEAGGGEGKRAHLAGQNPMLASMLAQTPRTPPSVPTSIANSIMSQLPQDRLPKNLEKKLIHTPTTTAAVVMAASAAPRPSYLSKMLSDNSSRQQTLDPHPNPADGDSAYDPLLNEILEQVWSLQQELNVPPSSGTEEPPNLMKILDEVLDTTASASATVTESVPTSSAQDLLSEKMAINEIQKQLMSVEAQDFASKQLARTLAQVTYASGSYQRLRAPSPLQRSVPQMRRSLIEYKRISLLDQHKRLTLSTLTSTAEPSFTETMNDLLNSEVAPPNVSLQRAEPQLSPRLSSPQLSPGGGQRGAPYSPLSQQQQQSFASPSPNSGFSPHPYSPRSPHLSPPGGPWSQPSPSLQQQQNPMLNAQLSQGPSFPPGAAPPRVRPAAAARAPVRTSTFPLSPQPSPVYQTGAPQQRGGLLTRAPTPTSSTGPSRVNSPRTPQSGFVDSLMSPQPPPSSPSEAHFSFEQQGQQQQLFGGRTGQAVGTSEYVRQELRAIVGARSGQLSLVTSSQQFTPEDLEALGLSFEMGPNDPQPHTLLTIASPPQDSAAAGPSRPRVEEPKPPTPAGEQKKSLLQQLLSEPP